MHMHMHRFCLSAEPFKIAILPVLALAPKARCPLGDIMCCDVTILTVMTSNSISLIFCASTITDILIACWTKTSYCQHRPRPVSSISYATAQKNLRQAAIWNLWAGCESLSRLTYTWCVHRPSHKLTKWKVYAFGEIGDFVAVFITSRRSSLVRFAQFKWAASVYRNNIIIAASVFFTKVV